MVSRIHLFCDKGSRLLSVKFTTDDTTRAVTNAIKSIEKSGSFAKTAFVITPYIEISKNAAQIAEALKPIRPLNTLIKILAESITGR